MKKSFIYLFIIVLIFCSINAQDIMITKDGQKLSVKVEEVGTDYVKYKKYENQTGTSYTIKKNDVASLIYENGDFEVFPQIVQKPQNIIEFRKAKNLRDIGIGLIGGGAALLSGGIGCYVPTVNHEWFYRRKGTYDSMRATGVVLMTMGSVSIVSGFVCTFIGQSRMTNIKLFQDVTLIKTDVYKFDMAIDANSISIKLKF